MIEVKQAIIEDLFSHSISEDQHTSILIIRTIQRNEYRSTQ